MKKTNLKLLASAMALGIAAISSVGSTFAWFSMNTTVAATGMQVTAKTNGAFLQIKNGNGEATDDTGVTASAKTDSASIYPAALSSATADKWSYAYSKSYTESTSGAVLKDVPTDSNSYYRLENKFTIYTKDDNTQVTDLKVATCKVTAAEAGAVMFDAVRVVVVCGTKVQEISAEGKTSGKAFDIDSAEVLQATVGHTDATDADITVYIYIFGGHDSVTSSNASDTKNLGGYSVELTFTATEPNV